MIVMQLAEPEGFKQSEEAVSGSTHHITDLPFSTSCRIWLKRTCRCLTLHYYDQPAGLLYLEDFGDVTLAEAVSQANAPSVESRYKQAINVLVHMQIGATTPADPGVWRFTAVSMCRY